MFRHKWNFDGTFSPVLLCVSRIVLDRNSELPVAVHCLKVKKRARAHATHHAWGKNLKPKNTTFKNLLKVSVTEPRVKMALILTVWRHFLPSNNCRHAVNYVHYTQKCVVWGCACLHIKLTFFSGENMWGVGGHAEINEFFVHELTV